jgi:hypothetical protein
LAKRPTRRQRDPLLELPRVRANFTHAAQCRIWCPEAATAYWLGLDPEVVTPESADLLQANSKKAREYLRRLELVNQALEVGELTTPIRPADFVSWTERAVGMPMPKGIRQAISNLHSASKKYANSTDKRGVDPRVHKTALIVLGSIAQIQLGFDPKASKNPATTHVKGAIEQVGLTLDEQTILDRLREAAQAVGAELSKAQTE